MTAVLSGIRIIDLTSVIMGPLATQFLGDMGADVIKVEAPGGDISRRSHPRKNPGMGQNFLGTNRNKRSICIDLKTAAGRAVLLKLVKSSDVLVYNVRPQAMARLRLSYEDVRAHNPTIIYVGAFGFSQKGSYASRPAYDDVIQGMVALPSLFAKSSGSEPRYAPMSFADRITAIHVMVAILGGLLHRERTGEGQKVDVPMFEHLAMTLLAEHLEGRGFEPPLGPMGHARSTSPERRPYRTKDGYICVLIYDDRHWQAFLGLVGKPELFTTDQRLSSYSERTKNIHFVGQLLSSEFQNRTTAEWLTCLGANDIPAGPLNELEDLFDDPHLRETQFFETVEHPSEGKLVSMRYPSEFSSGVPATQRHAPLLGEHTLSILEEAGFSPEEIRVLLSDRSVIAPEDKRS